VTTPNGCRKVSLDAGVYSNDKTLSDGDWSVYSRGVTYSRDCNTSGLSSLPVSWIGVYVEGYRNGGFCGSAYAYSTVTSSSVATSPILCQNPGGNDTHNTAIAGGLWNGSSYSWYGYQWSPSIIW
jgi:hypothetical protein